VIDAGSGRTWRSSVEGILECGRLLAEAKAELAHGEFGRMIEEKLPFKSATAQMLMKVHRNQRLVNPEHVRLLPPSWGTPLWLGFVCRFLGKPLSPQLGHSAQPGLLFSKIFVHRSLALQAPLLFVNKSLRAAGCGGGPGERANGGGLC
jgi:hypothetical protein